MKRERVERNGNQIMEVDTELENVYSESGEMLKLVQKQGRNR